MEGKKPTNLNEEFNNEHFDEQFSIDDYFNNDNPDEQSALLQEATYNYFNDNSINLEENFFLQDENTASSSNVSKLLPIEQIIQPSNSLYTNQNDTITNMLDDIENQRNTGTDINLQNEVLNNTVTKIEDGLLSISNDLDGRKNSNLDKPLPLQNTDFLSSTIELKKIYKRNPKYITTDLNNSIFNESPITKRARTPLFNSPLSTSRQSPLEVSRVPSPLPIFHLEESNHNNQPTNMVLLNDGGGNSGTLENTPIESNQFLTSPNINNQDVYLYVDESGEIQISDLIPMDVVNHTEEETLGAELDFQRERVEPIDDNTTLHNNLHEDSSMLPQNMVLSNDGGGNSGTLENTPIESNQFLTSPNTNNQDVYVFIDESGEIQISRLIPMDVVNHTEEETLGAELDFQRERVEPIDDNTTLDNMLPKESLTGIYKKKNNWELTVKGPFESTTKQYMRIGEYKTFETAARVRDLIALKLNKHNNEENFNFKYPISDYNEDLVEMQKWSEKDYIWLWKRKSVAFATTKSGFKGVYPKYKKKGSKAWEGRIMMDEKEHFLGVFQEPEIPAIFFDLVTLQSKKDNLTTNFRPGHYTQEDVDNFKKLIEIKKHKEASKWNLINRILEEPPIFSKYDIIKDDHSVKSGYIPFFDLNNPRWILEKSYSKKNINNFNPSTSINRDSLNDSIQLGIQMIEPREMAKQFMQCLWKDLENTWNLLRNPADNIDLAHEEIVTKVYEVPIWSPLWSPYNLTFPNLEEREKFKYDFFFPCVISTHLSSVNMERRIFGFNFHQYITNPSTEIPIWPQIPLKACVSDHQKQWISLPNMRYLPPEFRYIIACEGGLFVLKGGKQPLTLSSQANQTNDLLAPYNHYWTLNECIYAKNQSIIIVTNPLTYETKALPPMPYKVLCQKIAHIKFYDGTKISYRLFVVGVHYKPKTQSPQVLGNTELALGVYCSKVNNWVHFDFIDNASPPPQKLGRPTIVVHGCLVYYGGGIIDSMSRKNPFLKPSIFCFNTYDSQKQHLVIDFSRAAQTYSIKTEVEPPRLVQVGTDRIVYAVTREGRSYPNILFVTEVLLNVNGVPTGFFKSSSNGRMPVGIFSLLFRRECDYNFHCKKKISQNFDPSWEVAGSNDYIAIKAIGFDPAIALYNVKNDSWKYTYFPYTEPIERSINSAGDFVGAWRLIFGACELRWNAIP